MGRLRLRLRVRALALALLLLGCAQAAEYLPDAGRLPGGELWDISNVGVEETGTDFRVPDSSTMTVAARLTSSATASDIQNALNACPSNQVVELGAGTYTVASGLQIPSGVVLRGGGTAPGDVVLSFLGGNGSGFNRGLIEFFGPFGGEPDAADVKNITAGFEQGSTVLTLDNVTGLSVGKLAQMDQINDNGIGVNHVTVEGTNTFVGRDGGTRAQGQTVKIVAIAGNQVTISDPIAATNYQASLSPQFWQIGTAVEMAGLENLTITNAVTDANSATINAAYYNIYMQSAWNCWVKNVQSRMCERSHFRSYQAGHIVVRDSDWRFTESAASESYGLNITYTTAGLFENNVFVAVTTPGFVWGPSVNNIFGFNFSVTNSYDISLQWQINVYGTHGAHPTHNLWEGNYGANIYWDFIHGSSSHNTAFRNVALGRDPFADPPKEGNTYPISLERNTRFGTVVGCWLGEYGYHTGVLLANVSSSTNNNKSIFKVGYNGTSLLLGNYDIETLNTFVRLGNFNTVTGGVPAEESLGGQTLRESWYRTVKPSWWGDRPWPWVDPASTNTPAYTNMPAGFKWVYGYNPVPVGGPGTQRLKLRGKIGGGAYLRTN